VGADIDAQVCHGVFNIMHRGRVSTGSFSVI
jgi:hypothetical protein